MKTEGIAIEVNDAILYRCNSGEWISVLARCNGIPECVDSSDEQNCQNQEIGYVLTLMLVHKVYNF